MTTTDARKRIAENNTVTVTVPPNDRAKRREAFEQKLTNARILAQAVADCVVAGQPVPDDLLARYVAADEAIPAARDEYLGEAL